MLNTVPERLSQSSDDVFLHVNILFTPMTAFVTFCTEIKVMFSEMFPFLKKNSKGEKNNDACFFCFFFNALGNSQRQ